MTWFHLLQHVKSYFLPLFYIRISEWQRKVFAYVLVRVYKDLFNLGSSSAPKIWLCEDKGSYDFSFSSPSLAPAFP